MKHWSMWYKHSGFLVLIFRACLAVHHAFEQGQWRVPFSCSILWPSDNWNINYGTATGRSQSMWSYFYGWREDSCSATNTILTSAVPIATLWIKNRRMQLSHEEHSAGPLLNQEQELGTLGEVSSNPQLPVSPWFCHTDPLLSPRQHAQAGHAKCLL